MTTFNLKDNIEDGMHPVQRYLNRARIMGVTKDRKWLLRIMSLSTFGYAKGNENINSFRLSSDKAIFKEQFFELFDIMDRKYGDLFDVQVDYSTSMRRYYFSFIVLYPKFEITNSSEHKRNITNLVVILPMIWSTDNECIYTKLLGSRLTLKYDEWSSGYLHSHLKKYGKINSFNKIYKVGEFCIGTEDMSELIITQAQAFDVNNFELMLYTLDTMVAWESEEGTPYYRMVQITNGGQANVIQINDGNVRDIYGQYIIYMKPHTLSDINHVYTDNRFRIKHDKALTKVLMDAFTVNPNLTSYAQHIVCKRGIDGKFYGITDVNELSGDLIEELKTKEAPFVYISGKKIPFQITEVVQQEQADVTQYIIHPKFLNYVSEQLEIKLYKACIRNSTIHKLRDTNDNVSGVIESNQISL